MIRRREWMLCLLISNLLILTFSFSISTSAQELNGKQGNEQSHQAQEKAQPTLISYSMDTVQSQTEQKHSDNEGTQNQNQDQETSPANDRLFGVLPNYLTVENEAKVPALTTGEKFKLVAKNSFDPAIYPFVGFVALIGQAQNSEPGFGQGAAGYGRRYSAAFGDTTIGNFMTGAIFPSILKQDPRYFQLAKGGFKRRTFYSVSRMFVTRTDSGGSQFNTSEVVGNLVAAGIANTYHPAEDRSLANTLSVWGTSLGWDAMNNIALEFWPDIHRWFKQKFLRDSQRQAPADNASLLLRGNW